MVYRRGSTLFAVPLARVPSGGHVEIVPVQVVSLGSSAKDIGDAVVAALESSDQLVAEPARDELKSPAQGLAGAKTWRQFVTGTAACDVEEREGCHVITPLRPDRGGGFAYDVDNKTALPPGTTPTVLGGRLLDVLESCEEH